MYYNALQWVHNGYTMATKRYAVGCTLWCYLGPFGIYYLEHTLTCVRTKVEKQAPSHGMRWCMGLGMWVRAHMRGCA